jgi:hypothetical protein
VPSFKLLCGAREAAAMTFQLSGCLPQVMRGSRSLVSASAFNCWSRAGARHRPQQAYWRAPMA